jgi:hypothetical protein
LKEDPSTPVTADEISYYFEAAADGAQGRQWMLDMVARRSVEGLMLREELKTAQKVGWGKEIIPYLDGVGRCKLANIIIRPRDDRDREEGRILDRSKINI